MTEGASRRRVLVGGVVVDGTGAPARPATVTLVGDRIESVVDAVTGDFRGGSEVGAGSRSGPEMVDAEVVDVAGAVVAPGFVDVHTHDDFAALLYPDLAYKLLGGVTSVVVGNCGTGAAPRAQAAAMAAAFHPGSELPGYHGYAGYLERLDAAPPSANVAALVGHGTARAAAMGAATGAPDRTQLDALGATVREGLDAGCIGLSSGLIYEPGRHAALEELLVLARPVGEAGGVYTSHIRDEGAGLLGALDEAVAVGEQAGVPVRVSHLKAAGRDAHGLAGAALDLLLAARSRGVDVRWDQYPYTAGSTVLEAVLDALGGSTRSGLGALGAEDVVVSSCAGERSWEGRSVADLATAWGTDPVTAAQRVLAADPGAVAVLHMMDEADVRTVLAHPGTLVGSDGLPTLEGTPHPRLYGTFARVLGTYVRAVGLLSLEDAVHRMTGASADAFGLHGRGVVVPGAAADLVVFAPDVIDDLATFEDPQRSPAGIRRVIVNGVDTVLDGRHTGARAGRVLRRA
jgi:N-acyl-D-aspartate/D-glutamate deacylase